ncbi:hypothetical protein X975_06932, partial [Stegodyphus mimosarum]
MLWIMDTHLRKHLFRVTQIMKRMEMAKSIIAMTENPNHKPK